VASAALAEAAFEAAAFRASACAALAERCVDSIWLRHVSRMCVIVIVIAIFVVVVWCLAKGWFTTVNPPV
jgi:t-SNARE complex subunit (syntaxin)